MEENVESHYKNRYQQFSSFWKNYKQKNEEQQPSPSLASQIQTHLSTPKSSSNLLANFQPVRSLEEKQLLRSIQDRELIEHLNQNKKNKTEDYYIVDPKTGKLQPNENYFTHDLKTDANFLFSTQKTTLPPLHPSLLQYVEQKNQQKEQMSSPSALETNVPSQSLWNQTNRRKNQRNQINTEQKPKKLSFRQKQQLEQQANLQKWIQTQLQSFVTMLKQFWNQFAQLFFSRQNKATTMTWKQLFLMCWNIIKKVLQRIVLLNPFMRAQMINQSQIMRMTPDMSATMNSLQQQQEGYRNSMVYYRNYSG